MADMVTEPGGSLMRLATIVTPHGLRLHVRARTGYVDVGEATGDPALSSVQGVLDAGPAGLEAVRGVLDRDGAEFVPEDFGPAGPEPRRILCLGVHYREHAIAGRRER